MAISENGKRTVSVSQVSVDDLHLDPSNARTGHDIEQIQASIQEFGFADPIEAQHGTGKIIAGNGRYQAAKSLGLKTVPVVWHEMDDLEATRYGLANNRLTDKSEWDMKVLPDLLTEAGLDIPGFDDFNLPEIFQPPTAQIDQAESLKEKWKTEEGQTWKVGRHLLFCGDYGCFMDSVPPGRTLFFDPPWDLGVELTYETDSVLAFADGFRFGEVISRFGKPAWVFTWDCAACWHTPNRPLRRAKYAIWYGDLSDYRFDGAFYGTPLQRKKASNSRGSYEFIPDPRGKHLADVYQESLSRLHSDGVHPHEKPEEWIKLLVGNCSTGQLVDPFVGVGASMVACVDAEVQFCGSEIDPKYVAVTLERMSSLVDEIKLI